LTQCNGYAGDVLCLIEIASVFSWYSYIRI